MHLPDIEYHAARSIGEAAELLKRFAPHARALAGGTDLLVDLKTGRTHTQHLVSLQRLSELRGVSEGPDGVRIGALTTPRQIADSQIIRDRFPCILDAVRQLAAPQVRNMATVGGNIASAVPSADLPPILISLHASVELRSQDGLRVVPLEAFIIGPRRTVLQPGEILTAVLIPNPPRRFGAAYARFALREANGCALAGVAASVRLTADGTVETARVVLGAVAPTATRCDAAAELLCGLPASEDALDAAAVAAMDAARPISDLRGSADYRRELVRVLTRRALIQARRRAEA